VDIKWLIILSELEMTMSRIEMDVWYKINVLISNILMILWKYINNKYDTSEGIISHIFTRIYLYSIYTIIYCILYIIYTYI